MIRKVTEDDLKMLRKLRKNRIHVIRKARHDVDVLRKRLVELDQLIIAKSKAKRRSDKLMDNKRKVKLCETMIQNKNALLIKRKKVIERLLEVLAGYWGLDSTLTPDKIEEMKRKYREEAEIK